MPPNQPYQPQPQYPVPPQNFMQDPNAAPQKPKKEYPWKWIIPVGVLSFLLLVSLGFGLWAYSSRQDFKDNSDQKSEAAVAIAVQQESTRKDNEFIEQEKAPFKKYLGSATFGGLELSYPKTWSAFINEANAGSEPIEGYFHPDFVPGLRSGTAFALHIEVVSQPYETVVKQFETKTRTGKVKVGAYTPKRVPNVIGTRVDGEINNGQQNSMVVLPLRDKTIKISTESQQFINDFNTIILENFSYNP